MIADAWGVEHSATTSQVAAWNGVVHAVTTHRADTAGQLDGLLHSHPGFASAVALKGLAIMFKGRRDLLPVVDSQIAFDGPLTAFEAGLFKVLRAWRDDRYDDTECALRELVALEPRNLLAVKLQHGFLFLAGRTASMRSAIEHAAAQWSAEDIGYGYVLGCQSFAAGEHGEFDRAERIGREAVERAPDDAWGIHAVSHVHEMRDENDRGAAWLTAHEDGYRECNNFRGHVFWHLALFELALGNLARVYSLCDDEVRRAWTGDYRDMSNVASLLWRLEVDGHDVGDRWEELGEIAAAHQSDHGSAFADAHYALALIRSGRSADPLLESIAPASCRGGQSAVVAGPGRRLCAAVAALGDGEFSRACELFEGVRSELHEIGGSNAQRDLFDQLHIDAALAGNDVPLARQLIERRLLQRPNNPWTHERVL
ncbi:MAG: tetratricopeptide repeat protein [Myxococcota bacterium]